MGVLAVADIYEALTAVRPYRGPLAPERALEILCAATCRTSRPRRVVGALESSSAAAPARSRRAC